MLDKTHEDWQTDAASLEIEGRAFINGDYQDGLAGETRATLNPANGEKLVDVRYTARFHRSFFFNCRRSLVQHPDRSHAGKRYAGAEQ